MRVTKWISEHRYAAVGFVAGAVVPLVIFLRMGTLTTPAWVATVVTLVGGLVYATVRASSEKEYARVVEKIGAAEARLKNEPGKAAPAWDLAQAKLELYFDRNLTQAKVIFVASLLVMAVGFGFVLYGIQVGLRNPQVLPVSYLASAAGVVSEFIGVTFLVLYRSTLAEANSFMSVLERINTVGMAVQILDSIPDAEKELKNRCRAELVHQLVSVERKSPSVTKAKGAGAD